MKRITAIELHNFLAFYGTDNKISLPKGENLLLYGENGSGKSSLCRALEVFFDARLHPQFDVHQRNIWATPTDPPTELVVTFDKPLPPTNAISPPAQLPASAALPPIPIIKGNVPSLPTLPQSLDVKTASSTTWVEESRLASGFLTYRDILKTHFLEENRANLFDLVVNEILQGYKNPTSGKILSEEWKAFEQQWDDFLKEDWGDPLSTRSDEFGEEKKVMDIIDDEVRRLREISEKFDDSIKSILKNLNPKVNEFLTLFDQNISVQLVIGNHLDYLGNPVKGTMLSYHNVDDDIDLLKELLDRAIDDEVQKGVKNLLQNLTLKKPLLTAEVLYFGRLIPTHQTFLNEARLTALAICIFLAALRLKPDPKDGCKVLFLDDVLIGLDSGNRLPLLKLLKTHFIDFQVMVSTHDRAWFEVAREHLPKNDWKWTAFFTEVKNEQAPIFEHPLIIDPSLDYLGKAKVYFRKKDYPASANFQRKWCEQFLKRYLQENYRLEILGDEQANEITKLNTLFGKLEKFYNDCKIELPPSIKSEFHLHRDTVMNPFSHDDLHSPVYKQELERGFRLIEELKKLKPLKKSVIAYRNDIIEYVESSLNYSCRFQITTEPLIMINHGGDISILGKGDVLDFTEGGKRMPAPSKGMNDLELNEFYDKISDYLQKKYPDHTPNQDRFQSLVLNPRQITLRQLIDG
jgi:energy-coupling factor transporter ATP-binding protein EcfA2